MSEGCRHFYREKNICYELSQHMPVTHNDANRICRSRNGQLAAIRDTDTQRYIERLLNTEQWIGGRLAVMEQWTWVDGSTYSGQQTVCH